MEYKSNDSRFKAIYQDYDWCYQKFIIEGLNHEEMALEANCTKRVIKKWCAERYCLTQKYRQQNKKLNKIQEDLIIGSLLGDGHIDKRETTPVFIVSHANNQKDYLFFKYELVKDLCNIEPTHKKSGTKEFYGKTYNTQSQFRLCTRVYDCLKKYRSMSTKELLNALTEFSFSIFVLDDGSRCSSNWDLCLAEYTESDLIEFEKVMKEKFNLVGNIQKDIRYFMFTAESSRKIDDIILTNIPSDLDIIKYKITEKYRCKINKRYKNNTEVTYG
jgi:hypothetical protein